jgi:FkbM family methyltransferase
MIHQAIIDTIQKYNIAGVLDVGANVGEYVLDMHHIFPNMKIFSIEANDECAPFLEKNIGHIPQVKYIISCLSDSEKETVFYGTREHPTCSGNSLYRENTKHYSDEKLIVTKIKTETLDNLLERTNNKNKFDFLKIDTQGSELDILQGASETLKYAKVLVVETSLLEYTIGSPLQSEIITYLTNLNFSVLGCVEEHRLDGGVGALFQQDLLFVKNKEENIT